MSQNKPNKEKKQSWLKRNMELSIIISIVLACITGYIAYERNKDAQKITHDSIEERIPEDVKTFVEWEDHMNEKPTDIENFQREQRLIIQEDIVIEQQVKLDSQLVEAKENLKVVGEFFGYVKEQRRLDSLAKIQEAINEVAKQESRDKRTQEIEDIGLYIRELKRKEETPNE